MQIVETRDEKDKTCFSYKIRKTHLFYIIGGVILILGIIIGILFSILPNHTNRFNQSTMSASSEASV